jgi:hypothetical protein
MLQQIDQLLAKRFEALSKNLDQKLEHQSDRFDQKLEHQSDRFDKKLEHQSAEIKRHTGVLLDGVQHKFDLVIEGQQMQVERLDCIEQRLESVEKVVVQNSGQIQGLAADLKTHRLDTEAHHGFYGVREE